MASIDNIRSGQSLANTATSRSAKRPETNVSESKADNTKQPSSSEKDAVSLSSQSKAIGEMHNKLSSSPAFDSVKVQAIKDAIANGSYKVDAEKLADSMIKFEKELGGI